MGLDGVGLDEVGLDELWLSWLMRPAQVVVHSNTSNSSFKIIARVVVLVIVMVSAKALAIAIMIVPPLPPG